MNKFIFSVIFLSSALALAVKVGETATYAIKNVNNGVVHESVITQTVKTVSADGGYTYDFHLVTPANQTASGTGIVTGAHAVIVEKDIKDLIEHCTERGATPSTQTISGQTLKTCIVSGTSEQGSYSAEWADVPFYMVRMTSQASFGSTNAQMISFARP